MRHKVEIMQKLPERKIAFLTFVSLPVITKRNPTDPVQIFTSCPTTSILSKRLADVYSSPNKLKIKFGNKNKITEIGIATKTINLLQIRDNLLSSSKLPNWKDAENLGRSADLAQTERHGHELLGLFGREHR